MDTLVLNNAYMPIDRVSWSDAFTDLLTGRAEVVEFYKGVTVRSSKDSPREGPLPHTFQALATETFGGWKAPSIIRFLGKAVFRSRHVKFNRHNVWLRDKGRCQYCNVKLKTDEFTYDHVTPRAQDGKTRWENIVVACIPCNHKKADRTPEQAKMRLNREPFRPRQLPGQLSPALAWREGMPETWRVFLQSVSYWHGGLSST